MAQTLQIVSDTRQWNSIEASASIEKRVCVCLTMKIPSKFRVFGRKITPAAEVVPVRDFINPIWPRIYSNDVVLIPAHKIFGALK